MKFEIAHSIRYDYSKPVFIEPHEFLLRPREDASQRVISHDFVLDPEPAMLSTAVDLSGNPAVFAWFREQHTHLSIIARSVVEIIRPNPFDYLPEEPCRRIPVVYREALRGILGPYLKVLSGIPETVKAFSHDIAARTHHSTIPFLVDLTRTLANDFEWQHRPTGSAWSSDETLRLRQGSCRDLAALFMACCRTQGLASRFVSGYFEDENSKFDHDLHAWAEVYIDGAGWRGFDPSAGLAVTDSHIPIAASAVPDLATPVSGSFRGTGTTSNMTHKVQITRLLQTV
jgi:transglutaminase-like putative cysteine protease